MAHLVSSHTPLVANDTYTDTVQSLPGDNLIGAVFSDKAGTLFLEQSLDNGTTWAISTSIAVTAGAVSKFKEPVYLAACRARYVNDGDDQTKFDLVLRAVSSTYSS